MKKVYQKFVDAENGDCMQAAYASLFGLEHNQVPKFIELGEKWYSAIHDFAMKHGYERTSVYYGGPDVVAEFSLDNLLQHKGIDGCFYAVVHSPKYYNSNPEISHAVICDKYGKIIHDPNPENNELTEYPISDRTSSDGIIYVWVFEKIKKL